MDERELAETLLRDHLLAASALVEQRVKNQSGQSGSGGYGWARTTDPGIMSAVL